MRTSPDRSQRPLLVQNIYLWAFIPAVVLLSIVVFVICLFVLLFGRAKAGVA